jgi:hypothetical protein
VPTIDSKLLALICAKDWIMTTQHHVTSSSLLQALLICVGVSTLLSSCRSKVKPEQAPLVDYSAMISDSILIYEPENYEQVVVIYSMPAHFYDRKKRGSLKDQMYNNADKLSIDTTVATMREDPRLQKWEITATPIADE